jgi:hypothetical protein
VDLRSMPAMVGAWIRDAFAPAPPMPRPEVEANDPTVAMPPSNGSTLRSSYPLPQGYEQPKPYSPPSDVIGVRG